MPRAGIRALPAQEARTKKRQANFTTCSLDITLPRNPTSRLAADSPHVPSRTPGRPCPEPPPHHPPLRNMWRWRSSHPMTTWRGSADQGASVQQLARAAFRPLPVRREGSGRSLPAQPPRDQEGVDERPQDRENHSEHAAQAGPDYPIRGEEAIEPHLAHANYGEHSADEQSALSESPAPAVSRSGGHRARRRAPTGRTRARDGAPLCAGGRVRSFV